MRAQFKKNEVVAYTAVTDALYKAQTHANATVQIIGDRLADEITETLGVVETGTDVDTADTTAPKKKRVLDKIKAEGLELTPELKAELEKLTEAK